MINEMRQEINDLRQMVMQLGSRQGDFKTQGFLPAQPSQQHGLVASGGQEEEFVTPEIIEDEGISLEERERHAIVKALERSGGNRKQAASELHISERTLYRKLKEYDIEK